MNYRFLFAGMTIFLLTIRIANAVIPEKEDNTVTSDSVRIGMYYLKYLLQRNENWYPISPELEKDLVSLLHYMEDEELDTVITRLSDYRAEGNYYFRRSSQKVPDSLSVPGYVSHSEINEQLTRLDRAARSSIVKEQIAVPDELFRDMLSKINLVAADKGEWLVENRMINIPDSLKATDAPQDAKIKPAEFKKIQQTDSARRVFIEQERINYNNRLMQMYVDSVNDAYRTNFIDNYVKNAQRQHADSVRRHNQSVLINYNKRETQTINDSIGKILDMMMAYAYENYTIPIVLRGSDNHTVNLQMRNNETQVGRLFIKNEQNDSLGIRVLNDSRNSLMLLIDDAVTFNRFARRVTKGADLSGLHTPRPTSLQAIQQRFKVETPWGLTASPNLSFTHTALENWKAGGRNSFALLFIFNGSANYAKANRTWKNSMMFRNGWIKKGGDKIEKNDDKIQLISRFGIKAAGKWNYSAELEFYTQFFNGYNYAKDPKRENPISAFMSPAYTIMKLGMEYIPVPNLTVLLSPLSGKLTSVRDTVKINQQSYGIEAGKKYFWKPGFSTNINWKQQIMPNITYSTRYDMFNGYENPFKKIDINWENTLTVQINTFVNMTGRLFIVYDDDVTFDTGRKDADGNAITERRCQIKEVITLGFTYTINKPIYRRKRI